jgi:hypothetical protein
LPRHRIRSREKRALPCSTTTMQVRSPAVPDSAATAVCRETRSSANVKVRNQPVRVGLLLDETRSRTESNCVTVRWGGKQLEVDLQSQTIVNLFRLVTVASLLGKWRSASAILQMPTYYISLGKLYGYLWLRWECKEGTPQGGVISPLLANIYLDSLDWKMSQRGFQMVRYADDMVVLCKSRKQAEEAPSLISTWMNEAELELNHDKSRVVDMNLPGNYFDFLGYRFKLSKAKRMMQLIKPGSKQKLKQTIKPLTKRNNGYSMEAICNTVNPILRGWYNYFKHAKANEPFLPLSLSSSHSSLRAADDTITIVISEGRLR